MMCWLVNKLCYLRVIKFHDFHLIIDIECLKIIVYTIKYTDTYKENSIEILFLLFENDEKREKVQLYFIMISDNV